MTSTAYNQGHEQAFALIRDRAFTPAELERIARWQAGLAKESGKRQSRAEWLGAARAARYCAQA